tara:strand:- start:1741 stop:2394 length:654 start_codon:yes stop_codon:yes gene_type:complete
VCAPDPNAAARHAAQQRINEKNYKYGAESVKYWNRETSYKRGKERAATGFSRRQSDAYEQALAAMGKARQVTQAVSREIAKTRYAAPGGGVGRDRKRARSSMMEFLAKQALVDKQAGSLNRQMDKAYQGSLYEYLGIKAKNRAALGEKPDWGAPVTMPPVDTGGQILGTAMNALSIAGSVVSIGSGIGSFMTGWQAAGKAGGNQLVGGLKSMAKYNP